MPTIQIQSTAIEYDEAAVVTFAEGLIGLPHLRRMVLLSQPEIAPFLWLASVEGEMAFLVLEPTAHFPGYAPSLTDEMRDRIGLRPDEKPLLLVIARITADWQLSSANLRAPLVLAPSAMRGAQIALTESAYRVDETLARLAAAA